MNDQTLKPEEASAVNTLAHELGITPDQLRSDAMDLIYMKVGFRPGDMIKIREDSEYQYEVANIKKFPHGWMVGIYDERPGDHVDYWNPGSLHRVD